LKIKIRTKDVTEVSSPKTLTATFISKLNDLKNKDASTAREQMAGMETGQGPCKVFWLEGDLRLLIPSAAFGATDVGTCIFTLAEHSGKGKRGGGYVLKNGGNHWTTYDTVDELIAAVS
jgi:hypothetical protein